MLPSKIMIDCDGNRETSRIFPSITMDGETSNAYISPFDTPVTNRYSSSTDNSTSPESYFNTPFQITPRLEHSTPRLDSQTYNREPYYTIHHDSSIHIIETPISNPTQLSYGTYYDRNSFEQNYNDGRNTSFNSNFPNTFNKNVTGIEKQYNERRFENNVFDRSVLGFEHQNNYRHTSFESHFQTFEPSFEQQKYDKVQVSDTPFHYKRARAIVGRKILGYSKASLNDIFKAETDESNIWQPQLPNEVTAMQYELFPCKPKNKFESPKISTNMPMTSNLSPFASPFMSSSSQAPMQYYENQSPTSSKVRLAPTLNIDRFETLSPDNLNRILPLNIPQSPNRLPFPDFKPPYNPSLYTGSSSSLDEIRSNKICTFCRKNGETPTVYLDHCVKEKRGNRFIASCPILRQLVCSTCGATGDEAHTITYCPLLTRTNEGKPLPSTTITLKSTRVKSNGRKRY